MSNKNNDEWLEAANENFTEALESDNISLAKDIIADTLDNGFSDAGREMNKKLRQYTEEKTS